MDAVAGPQPSWSRRRRRHRRARQARWILAIALLAGCASAAEPSTYSVVSDRSAFDTTGAEAADVFADASQVAREALQGGELRGETSVSDTVCNEAYPRRFSRLEGGVSFVAPGASLPDALQQVSDAWAQRGWDVEVAQPDGASLTVMTSTGVPVSVQVTLQVNTTDPRTIGAAVSAQTRCLKLPESVADSL